MRIVLVSPFAAERNALHQLLVGDGYEVTSVATREEALDLALVTRPDALIADVQLARLDGRTFVRALEHLGVRTRVILICSRGSCGSEQTTAVCMTKPIDLAQLRRYLNQGDAPANRVA